MSGSNLIEHKHAVNTWICYFPELKSKPTKYIALTTKNIDTNTQYLHLRQISILGKKF